MSNAIKPSQEVIDYFEALDFKFDVVTDSVYRDKRDAPVYFFQTNHENHTKDCSTIMASDAIRLYKNVSEPFFKRAEKTFGERCPNGHLRAVQPCKQCKKPTTNPQAPQNGGPCPTCLKPADYPNGCMDDFHLVVTGNIEGVEPTKKEEEL